MARTKLSDVKERVFLENPAARELWTKTELQRSIGMKLAQLRNTQGLTQAELAQRVGWDKAFVSRLESAQAGVPDTVTISRYVQACNCMVAMVIFDPVNDIPVMPAGMTQMNFNCRVTDVLPLVPAPLVSIGTSKTGAPTMEFKPVLEAKPWNEWSQYQAQLNFDVIIGQTFNVSYKS
jgi:transcriptional regulator with XRE-family HTH domain